MYGHVTHNMRKIDYKNLRNKKNWTCPADFIEDGFEIPPINIDKIMKTLIIENARVYYLSVLR